METRQQDVEKRERGKPVMLHLMKHARVSMVGSGMQVQKPVMFHLVKSERVPVRGSGRQVQRQMLDSPNACPLPQAQLAALPGYLVHCSQTVRAVGKTGHGQQLEETTRLWTTPNQAIL